ncbi:MAG: MnhB domain-containing protein [Andreesenia angusta]|nr:MnhB domain-containing protein [Andreesenia angusta]
MSSVILKTVGRIIVPFMQVFGIYVVLFGHISPGGGFAGGTILGASFIMTKLAYGNDYCKKKFKFQKLLTIATISILFYGIIKGYSFITGGSHIDSPSLPLGHPGNILSGAYIVPLNIAVGIIVTITIYFFYSFFDEGEV